MTTQAEKGAVFRDLHRGPGAFVLANVWDAASARLFAGLGYKALATTSAGFAYTVGLRDGEGDFGLAEALDHARLIVAAADLPVSADLENGYADSPEGVAQTIRQAAAAGLVGCTIEDTHPGAPGFYPFDLAVARIEAAAAAARAAPVPFTLTARADGLIDGLYDLDEAIRRLQAYEKVGADVLYAPFLRTLDDIGRVCASVGRPVNHLGGLGVPGETVASLGEAGVRRISLGPVASRFALRALYQAGKTLADTGSFDGFHAAPAWKPVGEAIGRGTPR